MSKEFPYFGAGLAFVTAHTFSCVDITRVCAVKEGIVIPYVSHICCL